MAKKVKKVLKVKKVKTEPVSDKFLANLNINGIDYKGEGETAFEAVKGIEAPMKGLKGTLTLKKGKQKAERFLGAVQMKRFVKGNKLNRLATTKYLLLTLK